MTERRSACLSRRRTASYLSLRCDESAHVSRGFKQVIKEIRTGRLRHFSPLIGVRTGAQSDFDVLDLDAKHNEARRWWKEHRRHLPETRVHRTRSGGLHLLFQHSPRVRCTAGKIALGVDTRGEGGYVIWWPAAGLPILSGAPRAPWPSWLLDLLRPPPAPTGSAAIVPDDRALASLVRVIVAAPTGQRNRMLFWASCRVGQRCARTCWEATALEILQPAAGRLSAGERAARR